MRASITRREAVRATVVLGAFAGLGKVFLRVEVAHAALPGAIAHTPVARAPGALEIVPGTRVASCSVVAVAPLARGSVSITLRDPSGGKFRVDVLKFDPRAPGVARAGSLAVYLHNGGSGTKASDEQHGLGAMALAALIQRREAAGMAVPSLSTLREHSMIPAGVEAASS